MSLGVSSRSLQGFCTEVLRLAFQRGAHSFGDSISFLPLFLLSMSSFFSFSKFRLPGEMNFETEVYMQGIHGRAPRIQL